MAQLRPKIVKLCKVVGGLSGMVDGMISARENTAASKFAAAGKAVGKSLEKVNAAYENAE